MFLKSVAEEGEQELGRRRSEMDYICRGRERFLCSGGSQAVPPPPTGTGRLKEGKDLGSEGGKRLGRGVCCKKKRKGEIGKNRETLHLEGARKSFFPSPPPLVLEIPWQWPLVFLLEVSLR
jgi:hypothetical protein